MPPPNESVDPATMKPPSLVCSTDRASSSKTPPNVFSHSRVGWANAEPTKPEHNATIISTVLSCIATLWIMAHSPPPRSSPKRRLLPPASASARANDLATEERKNGRTEERKNGRTEEKSHTRHPLHPQSVDSRHYLRPSSIPSVTLPRSLSAVNTESPECRKFFRRPAGKP
jgi:hypothetical protein